MKSIKKRALFVFLGCVGVAGAVATRAVFIQLVKDSRLEQLSRRQFQSKVLISPRRGTLLDRNNEPLAFNLEMQSLAANPAKIGNRRILARLLAKAIDIPQAKLLQKLSEKREFIWIKRHLTDVELNRLRKWKILASDGELVNGLWMVKESKRVYPHGGLAAHTLGDVNLDNDGLEGVELWANEKLKGRVVSVSAVRDALGRPTLIDAVAAKDIQDGEPVTLTIDATLQYEVEQELKAAVARTSAKGGTVIVMSATTGEILALANEPSFNPNDSRAPASHRRNRALTDGFEPGSTMKAVLLASALSHGMKLTDQLWGERGTFTVQGKRISEAEAHEKFEWTSLKKMIQVSSNIVAAKLALKVGADSYYNTLKEFGFGSKTGSGFPGEISGRFPAKKQWQPLTLANIGFGQGILVTPIQMVRAYAVFANGGFRVQPSFIKNGTIEPPKRILSQKVVDSVTEALHSVTQDKGTGINARLEGYEVAGKTGTAQMVDPETGRYSRSKYVASFIGYLIGTEPRVVVFTSIDEPRGVYYASETTAPLFKKVMLATANRLSLPSQGVPQIVAKASPLSIHAGVPLINQTVKQKPLLADSLRLSLAKVIEPTTAGTELKWQGTTSKGEVIWKMPSLHGLTPREALTLLKSHGFQIEMTGTGIVKSQTPEEGHALLESGTVKMMLVDP